MLSISFALNVAQASACDLSKVLSHAVIDVPKFFKLPAKNATSESAVVPPLKPQHINSFYAQIGVPYFLGSMWVVKDGHVYLPSSNSNSTTHTRAYSSSLSATSSSRPASRNGVSQALSVTPGDFDDTGAINNLTFKPSPKSPVNVVTFKNSLEQAPGLNDQSLINDQGLTHDQGLITDQGSGSIPTGTVTPESSGMAQAQASWQFHASKPPHAAGQAQISDAVKAKLEEQAASISAEPAPDHTMAEIYHVPMQLAQKALKATPKISSQAVKAKISAMLVQDPEFLAIVDQLKICSNDMLVWDKCVAAFYGHNGRLRSLTTYMQGKRSGPYQAYYGNGTLRVAKNFVQGLEDGVTKYYNSEGRLVAEQAFAHGRLHGESRSFYACGQLKDQAFYIDGKLNGQLVEFFENGQLKTQACYVNDRLQGSFTQYFENGHVFISNEYEQGLQNGIYRRFAADGDLLAEMEFVNGKREGWCFVFGKDNMVLMSAQFHAGKIINGHCGLQGRILSDYELTEFAYKSSLPACKGELLPSNMLSPLGYHLSIAAR